MSDELTREYVPRSLRDDGMIEAAEVAHYTHLNLKKYVPVESIAALAARVRVLEAEIERWSKAPTFVADSWKDALDRAVRATASERGAECETRNESTRC